MLVLLDISGSAGEPGAIGVPVHVHQRDAAGSLAVALHELGDRVALYGFRSQGRSAVHVVPVKRFDEEFDATVLQRLGGLVPGAYTRLGAAMRHGTAVLEKEAGTARRLLVVLSDGFAYDHGYERAYGEADARRALAEARWQGIGCVCLSIGADTDSGALRRVFGTAAYAAIPADGAAARRWSDRCSDRPSGRPSCSGGCSSDGARTESDTSRSRGERHDARRTAVLRPDRQRGAGVQGRLPPGPVRPAQGPDRVRQDPLRRGHGLRPRPPAGHRRLPRRPDHRRSGRAGSSSRAAPRPGSTGP